MLRITIHPCEESALKTTISTLVYDDLLKGTLRYQIRGNARELGTDRPYGGTHQFGCDFSPGSPIPARPFLGLTSANERDVLDIIREHLRKTVGRV